jgi:hypothetical protein
LSGLAGGAASPTVPSKQAREIIAHAAVTCTPLLPAALSPVLKTEKRAIFNCDLPGEKKTGFEESDFE